MSRLVGRPALGRGEPLPLKRMRSSWDPGERPTRRLGRQIGSVATSLRERVVSGGRVAVLMENSPEYVAACYGTWISGGVLVGLNPALKGEELARLIRHSGAQCLVVDRNHPESDFLRERVGSAVRILDVRIGDGFSGRGRALGPPGSWILRRPWPPSSTPRGRPAIQRA